MFIHIFLAIVGNSRFTISYSGRREWDRNNRFLRTLYSHEFAIALIVAFFHLSQSPTTSNWNRIFQGSVERNLIPGFMIVLIGPTP